MNEFHTQTGIHKLTLSLRPETCLVADPDLPSRLRQLAGVLRVEVHSHAMEVTVWFAEPAEGLLAAIHAELKRFGCNIAAGRVQ
jgi:ubiquinone biosynthesis protein UbiJ